LKEGRTFAGLPSDSRIASVFGGSMRAITHPEIQQSAQALYDVLQELSENATRRARKLGSPFPWCSLKTMCSKLGIPNSGRNRKLMVRAKLHLSSRGMVKFFRVFQAGEAKADLFEVLKSIDLRKAFARIKRAKFLNFQTFSYGVAFGVSLVVPGADYPASWDEVTA
jgi:hypothetical protein